MTPGAPNSPEREAWMKEQRLRDDIAAGEAHIAGYQDWLNAKRRQLAEALCPFKVGDIVESIAPEWIGRRFEVMGVFPQGADSQTYVEIDWQDKGRRSFSRKYAEISSLRLASAEPRYPEAEIRAFIAAWRSACGVDLGPSLHELDLDRIPPRHLVEHIIAALDAVRAERRAKARDARVEAVRNVLMSKWGGDAGSRTNAMDVLAAADAAEARDA